MARWTLLAALILGACAGKAEPSPAAPTGASKATPSASATASPEPSASASASESEAAEPPPEEGPKENKPAWCSVGDLSPDKQKQLVDGFYFVDGTVTRLPCKACAKEVCKMGETCHMKPCMYCNATVMIADGRDDITIDHPDRDNVPPYRLNERVRIVLEKRGPLRLFVRKSKPCPPSECLETDPPKRLKKPEKGAEIRHDGERCFETVKGEEERVRCP